MSAGPKLRFGIMCNGRRFAAWEADCIRRLIASGHAEPALLIRDVTPADERALVAEARRAPPFIASTTSTGSGRGWRRCGRSI